MGRVVTLTERFAFAGGKVRRDGAYPVIEGVLLCGRESANRRRYLKDYCAGDRIKLYDGVPVFLNHGTGKQSRQYQDKIGSIENPRHRADGMPVGDIAINPSHPFAEAVLFDAEHKPRSCGMSHVAQCETRSAKDGWDDVTTLIKAESVDLVVDPATTRGLYENKGTSRMGLTVKAFVESLVRHPKTSSAQVAPLKVLAEMDGMDGMEMPADAEPPPDDADPADGVTAAFKSAVMHFVDQAMSGEMDAKEALQKIKKLFASHGEVNGTTPTEEPAIDTGEEPAEEEEEPTEENRKPDYAAALALVKEAKIELPADDLELLAAMVPAHRPELLKRLTKLKENKPAATPAKSAARAPGAGDTKTKVTEQKAVPTDAKSFAKSVRE